MRSRRFLLALCAAAVVAPLPAVGQQTPGFGAADSTLVDRIAAVVGDSVILMTEVQQQVLAARSQGQNPDPRRILSEMVDHLLIIQAAARDTTLRIPEEELDRRLEERMGEIRGQFPSQAAFQTALEESGFTLSAFRDFQRSQIRTSLLRELFTQRRLQAAPPVSLTEAEMRDYFERARGSLEDERPELLTLQQVLVPVKASEEAWARARTLADSLLGELRAGADFAELAREHSADPGSAADGGDLGWFRRGQMVRGFEAVAFRQRPGTLSEPVKTDYGWHLIFTDRARPGEVKASHILLQPEITEADRQAALERAGELAEEARGGADLQALTAGSREDDQPEEFDEVERTRQQLGELVGEGGAGELAGIAEGDVVGPFRTTVGNGEYFAVIRIQDVREAGEFTFEDMREQIRGVLSQQKKMERILERLRTDTYIDIRM